MKLRYYPDTFLSQQMTAVDVANPGFDPAELKKQMVDFMLSNNGIGLAANQIGMDAQVFVMGTSETNCNICINPTLLQFTEELQVGNEGCLSFPGIYVDVKRPKDILAEFYDHNLEKQVIKITGPSAKVYLHELDHLLGITLKDRVSSLRWNMASKRAAKLSK